MNPTTPAAADLPHAELLSRLRDGAIRAPTRIRAAIWLLLEDGYWLTEPWFLREFVHISPTRGNAWIAWQELPARLPGPRDHARVLEFAAVLAVHTWTLTFLPEAMRAAVCTALEGALELRALDLQPHEPARDRPGSGRGPSAFGGARLVGTRAPSRTRRQRKEGTQMANSTPGIENAPGVDVNAQDKTMTIDGKTYDWDPAKVEEFVRQNPNQ